MAVKIRLSRTGKKHVPFYSIVAVDGRKKRDGACLEDLGTYDAINSKIVNINQERIDYWISVGAVPTDAFTRINRKHKKATAPASAAAPVVKKAKVAKAPKAEQEAKQD